MDDHLAHTPLSPELLPDPNPLTLLLYVQILDPSDRVIGYSLASIEGIDDVAMVLMEPLLTPMDQATPLSLEQAPIFSSSDPGFPEEMRRKMERILRMGEWSYFPSCSSRRVPPGS
ncbi:hypothetical protein [Pajaroellobacter abortibovis]|uniref:Uncharacterized protein n=1 Tax=Pajaroellobacter abortibovis TaxID=1882918 RepID=A0A1L6MUQ6_9BACT|nr:hypothetical protein [Pajaroellobacter abortibovis]APR99248.1 hypothetical protein BCY86_00095 [Pajaroellobacter abortibovis]